jgi:hypothetical protein
MLDARRVTVCELVSRFHGRDERVKVQSFYEAQTSLYDLVRRLSMRQ